jgi:hypothetical protein
MAQNPMPVASLLAIASAILTPALAQTYIGASACGQCHPQEFRRQSSSDHAHSLYPATLHPLAAQFVPRTPLHRDPNYEFRFALEKRGLLLRIAGVDRAIVLPIEWAFGAGSQAVTFVTHLRNNNYLEHYFTFYTKTREMGITPGQEATQARDLTDAAGVEHQTLDIAECFYCHSTGPVQVADGDVRPNENGVRCEACHGPGSEHQRTKGKVPLRNPRDLSARELNDACGKCHRLPVSIRAAFDWDSPWNVRFEPAYLSQSACFLKSGGKLSCLSCHAAHDSPPRSPDYYNSVCVSCHASVHVAANMDNCIVCHMPRTSPRGPLQFTDHWIGVYQPGHLRPEAR